jgi:hypothetical protein
VYPFKTHPRLLLEKNVPKQVMPHYEMRKNSRFISLLRLFLCRTSVEGKSKESMCPHSQNRQTTGRSFGENQPVEIPPEAWLPGINRQSLLSRNLAEYQQNNHKEVFRFQPIIVVLQYKSLKFT